ncbi:TraB/GumN family protein [Microbulbifer sp. CAU 1566]|uniref:TraB/GumN family protein n=1 Tax=Microbulbifer sp. CAU 1566 TaxID=2933269 RepID=UPI002005F47D|nr:TraB/GumN family protein [Microbulbifer sp. CAU 1566]MCK7597117.1 TraB/GumN family protein [Microbulbifer sp. CAU 1566]
MNIKTTRMQLASFNQAKFLSWLLYVTASLFLTIGNGANAANDRGLLLEAKKGEQTLYLLGSIHLADQSFYPLRTTIEEAYKKSDALVVEADIIAMESDPKLQQQVMLESLYPPGDQLKNHISPKVYAQLQAWLRERNLPEENFNRLRPAIAMITLSLMEMQARGLDPTAGIDRHFLTQAHRGKKPILELESVLQQLHMLNSLDQPELYLQQTLEQLSEMDTFVPRITKAWKSGDQDALYNLVIVEGQKEHPEFTKLYELLFYQRNREMAKKIEALSQQHKSLFVVVGAGHLVGDASITTLLKQSGFTIKQI